MNHRPYHLLNLKSTVCIWVFTFVLIKTVSGTCPTEQPEFGSSCSLPDLTQCSYGEECCCGKCHPRWAFMSLRNPKNSSTLQYFQSLTKTSKKNSTLFVQLDNGVWKRNLEWILQRELFVAKLWIDKISWNDSLHSKGHLWGENIWLVFLYIMRLNNIFLVRMKNKHRWGTLTEATKLCVTASPAVILSLENSTSGPLWV